MHRLKFILALERRYFSTFVYILPASFYIRFSVRKYIVQILLFYQLFSYFVALLISSSVTNGAHNNVMHVLVISDLSYSRLQYVLSCRRRDNTLNLLPLHVRSWLGWADSLSLIFYFTQLYVLRAFFISSNLMQLVALRPWFTYFSTAY